MTKEDIQLELNEMSLNAEVLLDIAEAIDKAEAEEQSEQCSVCTTQAAMNAIDQVIINTLLPEGELSRKTVKNLLDLGELKLMLSESLD